MPTLTPWILVGALAGSIAIGGAGYFKGDADAAHRYQAKIATMQAQATTQAAKIRDAMTAQANAAVSSLETKNAADHVVFKTINHDVDRIVEMPVYRNVCFDDPGLRLANAALGDVPVTPAVVSGAATGMPRALAPQ